MADFNIFSEEDMLFTADGRPKFMDFPEMGMPAEFIEDPIAETEETEAEDSFRFPQGYIGTGYFPGNTKYCIQDGKIYEGFMPGGKCVAHIDPDGRVYKGAFKDGTPCLANISSDGHIYEGYFPGKCLGVIIDGKIYLGGYFPTGAADFNIS